MKNKKMKLNNDYDAAVLAAALAVNAPTEKLAEDCLSKLNAFCSRLTKLQLSTLRVDSRIAADRLACEMSGGPLFTDDEIAAYDKGHHLN
jgi:hypothetical protein